MHQTPCTGWQIFSVLNVASSYLTRFADIGKFNILVLYATERSKVIILNVAYIANQVVTIRIRVYKFYIVFIFG